MEFLGLIWDQGIMRPMINALALLYHYLFLNYGLSIIVFTVIVRVLMIPLTVRQTRQMKKLQALQPRMKAIQDKYKDKKDSESRRAQSSESMALYREAGVNPIGCLGPMVIQMPIWIGFYRAIIRTMPTTPEGMANLSASFYAWNPASADVPFSRLFLGIDLADTVSQVYLPLNFVLPVLVGASMFITTKMSSTIAMDERQQSQQRIMQWMMPVMIGVFTYQFPAGLGIYILLSNIVGVFIQYFVGGKQPIELFGKLYLGTAETRAEAIAAKTELAERNQDNDNSDEEETTDDDSTSIHRQERTRGNRRRARNSRRRARRRRH
ncbi:MAG: YidC/Oxa1 family membrane protein insertase [Chloroflexi bacterium]|nr:YidC/Oxa1 family membrane protein insertase [Chloroflexota bacterium]